MLAEHEPKQTTENALTIDIGDKRMFYSRQDWYTNKDIALAVRMNPTTVNQHLHRIREDDKGNEFTTLGELKRKLKRKGKLAPIGSSQTIVCNEENFIKAVIAVASIKTKSPPSKISFEANIHKSPASKEKKPEKPNKNNRSPFNPFSSANLNARKPQEKHRTPPKEMLLNIKFPEQILAVNSVIKALSHLANGTLKKDIPNNTKEFLEQAAMEHVKLPRFEDDPDDPEESILIKILRTDSPIYLKTFFRVNLGSVLDDLWDVIEIDKERSKEEKEIIEICNQLKEKGYDKERAAQELLDHFPIPPKQTLEDSSQQEIDTTGQMFKVEIVPNPPPSEIPTSRIPTQPRIIFSPNTQIALSPAPIPQGRTIFEEGNHNDRPQHGNTGKKRINESKTTQALAQQEEEKKRLKGKILSDAAMAIREKVLTNNYNIPSNVRIILGHYLPPHASIPDLFGDISQEELNRLVIQRLNIALSTNPNKEQLLSRVSAILKPSQPVQDGKIRLHISSGEGG